MYKYPDFLKKATGKEKEKVTTAVLSTTVKAKVRAGRKQKADGGDVAMADDTGKTPNPNEEENKELTEEEKKKKEEEAKKAEPEPDF